jgi:hypothetical protein
MSRSRIESNRGLMASLVAPEAWVVTACLLVCFGSCTRAG